MIVIESTGRRLKDAIDSGLEKLGKTLAEVEIEVIDNGGLFRKAKVRITAQSDEVPQEKKAEAPAVTAPVEKPRVENQVKAREEKNEKREVKSEDKPVKPVEKREPKRDIHEHQTEKRERQAHNVSVPEQKEEQKEPRRYEPITPELVKKAEGFVTELIEKMGIKANIDTAVEDGELHINLTTEGSTAIGYHGEVLDSIEYMTGYVVNRDPDKYYHVWVDCNNYREKRKESLIALANKMAAKCIKVRHKIVLEPMNSNERKIIHSALANNDQIITRSEGHEPNRHIVILCKKRY